MSHPAIPMPSEEMRGLVGPRDPEDFDNPSGRLIYPLLAPEAYEVVFDFGCGCGRVARKLIQQNPRPKRYIGIDPHRGMIDWANTNLAPAAPGFEFHHHDVYSPGYAPGNAFRLADRFPAEDSSATLAIAHSVFTHLTLEQTEYYLSELARVLAPNGILFTSWLFFDNVSCPFWPGGANCLYVSEKDFSAAVLYDRGWFLRTIQRFGLTVERTDLPVVPGHQWCTWLRHRRPGDVDQFPLGEEGAAFVCGATWKPAATGSASEEARLAASTGSRHGRQIATREVTAHPPVPPLFGLLAQCAALAGELAQVKAELAELKQHAVFHRAAKKVAAWFKR